MDTAALQRFIMHYERLTRAMLDEMPDRADLVFELNKSHQIDGVQSNPRTQGSEV
jgi:D-glycerate 3-kinase